MNKKFAIYARQSIDKPDSISIESQIERCRIEVGNATYTVYSDQGYSGKNTDRPGFQAMLEAVCNGEIQCVVCYKLDRCSRSILDFTQLMDLFGRYDVGFISCTEKFDTSSPIGRAMLSICIVFAQLERETIQQRIMDAYHSRCRKGFFMGGRIPFGFRLKPYLLDGKKTSCYEKIESEVMILEKIYDIYQNPSASLSDIVLGLQDEHIRNPRRDDGLWVRPHIGRMIKNPIYVRADDRIYEYFEKQNTVIDNPKEDFIGYNGCYLYQIGKENHLVLAPHEGIVPSEVWLRCQKGLPRRRASSLDSSPASWLIGKLKCGYCGHSVAVRQSVGKNQQIYRYFICPQAQGKACRCTGFKPFPASQVETAMAKEMINRIQILSKRAAGCATNTIITRQLHSRLMELAESSESLDCIEALLIDFRRQLLDRKNYENQNTVHADDWERISNYLSQWDDLSLQKRITITDLMIDSISMTEAHLTISWRV